MQIDNADILLTDDYLDSRGGHGHQCASITVKRRDGKVQRFWVKVYMTDSMRVKCKVTACRPNQEQDPSKDVTGAWFEPRNA